MNIAIAFIAGFSAGQILCVTLIFVCMEIVEARKRRTRRQGQ